jgi:hypothetical protein
MTMLSSMAPTAVSVTSVPADASAPLDRLRKFLDTHGMNGKTGPRAFA